MSYGLGRTNLFQMDIQTMGPPIVHKPYPIPLKYQKFTDEEIRLLENSGCISKSLSLWATPVIIVPKRPDPLNPQKQTASLSVRSLKGLINTAHNGNRVISYCSLPNITDLLVRLQKCTIFSSLDLR